MTRDETAFERQRRKRIAQALRDYDLMHSQAGVDLMRLSPATKIESLEIIEDEILLGKDEFSGPVVWHVTLTFPEKKGPPIISSETFPGLFRGHFEKDIPTFDSLDVDLASLRPLP